jgi:hypothetical protein
MEDNGRDRVGLTTGTVRTIVDMGRNEKGADGVMEQAWLKNRQRVKIYNCQQVVSTHTARLPVLTY